MKIGLPSWREIVEVVLENWIPIVILAIIGLAVAGLL